MCRGSLMGPTTVYARDVGREARSPAAGDRDDDAARIQPQAGRAARAPGPRPDHRQRRTPGARPAQEPVPRHALARAADPAHLDPRLPGAVRARDARLAERLAE